MSSETESDIETSVPTTMAAEASPARVNATSLLKAIDERIKTHPELVEMLKDIPLPKTYKGPLLTEAAKEAAKAAKAAAKSSEEKEKKPKETEPVLLVDGKPLVKPSLPKYETWLLQNHSEQLINMTVKDRKALFEKYVEDNKDSINKKLKEDFDNYDKLQKEQSPWKDLPNKVYNEKTHRWNTLKQKKTETVAAP